MTQIDNTDAAKEMHAGFEDLACEAILIGDEKLANSYILRMIDEDLRPDYTRLTVCAVQVGNKDLALKLFSKLPENERDYFKMSALAKQAGYPKIADEILGLQSEEILWSYWLQAREFALADNSERTHSFLNKLPSGMRKYRVIAACAISKGNRTLAESCLDQLEENQRHYNFMAGLAAHNGFKADSKVFLNKLPKEKQDLIQVIALAANGGQTEIVKSYLRKVPKNIDFSRVINAAKAGKHFDEINQLVEAHIQKGEGTSEVRSPLMFAFNAHRNPVESLLHELELMSLDAGEKRNKP